MTTFAVICQPLGVSKTPGSLSSEVITTEWRVYSILLLTNANFVLQGNNAVNEATDGCVWTFEASCCGIQSASEQSQLCELSGPTFGFTTQEFNVVGGYTEKTQNCQNWGVGTIRYIRCCYNVTVISDWSASHSYQYHDLSARLTLTFMEGERWAGLIDDTNPSHLPFWTFHKGQHNYIIVSVLKVS